MSGKRVKRVDCEAVLEKMNENRDFMKKLEEEKDTQTSIDQQIYCAIDNRRCDGVCKKANTDKTGIVCCSEQITSKELPRKRRRKKKRFFTEE
jgi:hypothetical protein